MTSHGNLVRLDMVPHSVEVETPPSGLQTEFKTLFSPDALQFLSDLCSRFQPEVDKVLRMRILRKVQLDLTGELPGYLEDTAHIRSDPSWRVSPVPVRLQCRHVDIGDLSPCDTQRLTQALKSTAQGIQVDFDDGNCPTYYNQIKGIYNVYKVVHSQFPDVPPISQAPVLMLRPRAWNMVEHNMLVNGREVPGPLLDFGLLMFHNAKLLLENQSGPFFYLSKVESYLEARLWNQIFLWTEEKLGLPVGSIKATVLIECILATFEMEEILFELKEHSAGLNCGIWDYSASFVNKFGHRAEFLLPDRSKYVNMEKRFLRSYMELLVQTCHRRGALATGGMAALLLPPQRHSELYRTVLNTVTRLKLLEIKAGVDGFMVYDMNLIEPMQKLFQLHCTGQNQLQEPHRGVNVTPEDLLTVPAVWQWIRHQVKLEDDGKTVVTRGFVRSLTQGMMGDLRAAMCCQTQRDKGRLITAASMFLELVQKSNFPEFLTTYLYLDHTFLSTQNQYEEREMDGSHRAKL
ncbi:Malate synthase, glyoxysomal [Bagarius yarrelli]|uniref:malate synthase n=1 Tax=Bagarius yarrelli TaxID=175774 RepID=A0A556U900_BAGYA|nr:Malate synthase, glyoxysomal [Bagarius yarrelli]